MEYKFVLSAFGKKRALFCAGQAPAKSPPVPWLYQKLRKPQTTGHPLSRLPPLSFQWEPFRRKQSGVGHAQYSS